jgi:hypothetical protein
MIESYVPFCEYCGHIANLTNGEIELFVDETVTNKRKGTEVTVTGGNYHKGCFEAKKAEKVNALFLR